MSSSNTRGFPETLEEYKKYVADRESQLAAYATKSDGAVLFDGTSSDEYYRERFANAEDQVTLDRNRFRTLFQIDRDRIEYSSYFLRLAKKTQILTSKDGLVETRLSHTVRVAQIARSLCMGLRLNQDLAEAIALGHDLGHVPFAHRGERSLRDWLVTKLGQSPPTLQQQNLFHLDAFPVLARVRPSLRDAVLACFTLGNDPQEDLFMHGRQSFRLLAIKYKEGRRAKFTRQVLFGIWRHSLTARESDPYFHFKTIGPGDTKCSISGSRDLTPECQAVRYADDISTILDLIEGIEHGFVTAREIQDALNGYAPDEDYLGGSIPQLFYDLSRVNASRLLTYFISDFIRNNLPRLEKGDGPTAMTLSQRAEQALTILRKVTKDRLHAAAPLARGDMVSESRVRALCEWYDRNPKSLVEDIQRKMKDVNFPYRLLAEEERKIFDDEVFRAASICDFISILTDEEVRRLSEPM